MGKGQEALHRLTAAEARARLACGEITARALLEACLARIAEREQTFKNGKQINKVLKKQN